MNLEGDVFLDVTPWLLAQYLIVLILSGLCICLLVFLFGLLFKKYFQLKITISNVGFVPYLKKTGLKRLCLKEETSN